MRTLIRILLWLDDKTFNWRSVEWLNRHVIDRAYDENGKLITKIRKGT